MLQLPEEVLALWEPRAQQEILVRMLEAMARAMRDTMQENR